MSDDDLLRQKATACSSGFKGEGVDLGSGVPALSLNEKIALIWR